MKFLDMLLVAKTLRNKQTLCSCKELYVTDGFVSV